MSSRLVLPTIATTVVGTGTGVAINVATDLGAELWPWIVVGLLTVLGAAAALWLQLAGQPTGAADPPPGPAPGTGSRRDTYTNVGTVTNNYTYNTAPAAIAAGFAMLVMAVGVLVLALTAAAQGGSPPTTPAAPPPASSTSPDPPPPTTDDRVPPADSPVGAWMSTEFTHETLRIDADGSYEVDQGLVIERGTYEVQGRTLTLDPEDGGRWTARWPPVNDVINLEDGSGTIRQYVR